MSTLLDKICAELPQLTGDVGCMVAEDLIYCKQRTIPDYKLPEKENQSFWRGIEQVCLRICESRCVITKAIEIAKEKWPCEDWFHSVVEPVSKRIEEMGQPPTKCPSCHGWDIAKEAFQQEPWPVIEKIIGKNLNIIYPLSVENYEIRGQWWQFFWAWDQLRQVYK